MFIRRKGKPVSEWEDFCGARGMDVGPEAGNIAFIDGLSDDEFEDLYDEEVLVFSSCKEALACSKVNGVAAFTRHGNGTCLKLVEKK